MRFRDWLYESFERHGEVGFVPYYKRQGYNQSVQSGLRGEEQVRKQMNKHCGWYVEPSTQDQDKYQGIDGHLVSGISKTPIQIKRQMTGNRIGYEVARDFHSNDPNQPPDALQLVGLLNGKDWKTQAELYVLRNMDNTQIRVVSVQEARQMINQAIGNWKQALVKFAQVPAMLQRYRVAFNDGKISMFLKFDSNDSYWKCMAYIEPSAFKSLKVCDLKSRNFN
jgi:hypothetical protein